MTAMLAWPGWTGYEPAAKYQSRIISVLSAFSVVEFLIFYHGERGEHGDKNS